MKFFLYLLATWPKYTDSFEMPTKFDARIEGWGREKGKGTESLPFFSSSTLILASNFVGISKLSIYNRYNITRAILYCTFDILIYHLSINILFILSIIVSLPPLPYLSLPINLFFILSSYQSIQLSTYTYIYLSIIPLSTCISIYTFLSLSLFLNCTPPPMHNTLCCLILH